MKSWKFVIPLAVLRTKAVSLGDVQMDSSNLQYDGKTIHSNYNGWIQNLDKAIRTQLTLL